MKVCKLCLQTFFMPLPYPLTFYGSKVFRFSSPIFRLPEPTPGFTGSLHPSFVNQAKVRKNSFLQKKGNIQTEYFISENGRYIQAPANKESHLPKGRSVSSEIPSRNAGISLISGANHSDSYEKTILQRIACMIRQTFSTVYSEYNQRISSHTACLLPSPTDFSY